MESFNSQEAPANNDFPIEPTRTRPERSIDAVYPWEQTKPVQRAELDALVEVIADIESRVAILKEMMQLVVSEVGSLRAMPLLLTRFTERIVVAADKATKARAAHLVSRLSSIDMPAACTLARLAIRTVKVVVSRGMADDR